VTDTIDITVVIPCYNLGAYVTEAVDSAVGQKDAAVEVLVIDDGSPDRATVETLDALARSRPIRLIRTPNAGVAAARNRGLAEAHGAFICFLDADDRLEPGALAKLGAALRDNPKAALAYPSGYKFGAVQADYWFAQFNRLRLLTLCVVPVPALLRRSAIGDCRFRTTARGFEYEDWDFFIQVTRRGAAVCVPEMLYGYRERAGSRVDAGLAHHDEVIADLWAFNPEDYEPAGLMAVKRAWAPALSVLTPRAQHEAWSSFLHECPWLDAEAVTDSDDVKGKYLWETTPDDAPGKTDLLTDLQAAELERPPENWFTLRADDGRWAVTEDLAEWAGLDEKLWRLSLPAWTKPRLPRDLYELAGPPARLRRVLAEMARLGIARYALFGAGKHPTYLSHKGWLKKAPHLVFDDFSTKPELAGAPVVKPTPENIGRVEAILVCSDAFERPLFRRACEATEGRIPVFRLYT